MNYIPGLIYLIITGAAISSMAALFLQGQRNKTNAMYMVCQIFVIIWCSSQVLIALSTNLLELSITYIYGNLGICFAGASWVAFSLNYGDKGTHTKWAFLPYGISLIHYCFVLTNNIHHLYYTEFGLDKITHGVFFYSNVITNYIYILAGTVILNFRIKKHSFGNSKRGMGLVIAAVIVPLVFSVVNIADVFHIPFDITPLAFAISVMLIKKSIDKYQFFDMKRELDIATEKLILEKERNRIAGHVHDTLGHTLTLLQSYMKLTEVSVKADNKEEALGYISEARHITSNGIKDLRESINQLREGENLELVSQGIYQLSSQIKEIKCEVLIRGEDGPRYSHLSRVVYETVRESITNTLKYANAHKIDIIVSFKEKSIEIVIADDGNGCENIVDNNGLRGIRERIEEKNGKVRFMSSKGEGFMTRVDIPLR